MQSLYNLYPCTHAGITADIHSIVESLDVSSDDGLSQSCGTTTTTSSSCSNVSSVEMGMHGVQITTYIILTCRNMQS